LNLGKQPEYLNYRLKTKKHYKVVNGKDNHNYFVVEASDGKNTKNAILYGGWQNYKSELSKE
jgi:hypothetical protein